MLTAGLTLPGNRSRITLAAIFALLFLFAAEIILTSMLTGRTATNITLNPLQQANLFSALWQYNPWKTLGIMFIDNAIILVEHIDPATQTQTWGYYYYLSDLLVHLGVALTLAFALVSGRLQASNPLRWLLLTGGLLLVIGSSHVKLGACCGVGPRWTLDAFILSHAFNPTSIVDWASVYEKMENLFKPIQFLIIAGGIGCMAYAWIKVEDKAFRQSMSPSTSH
jgi:hypothetical protein